MVNSIKAGFSIPPLWQFNCVGNSTLVGQRYVYNHTTFVLGQHFPYIAPAVFSPGSAHRWSFAGGADQRKTQAGISHGQPASGINSYLSSGRFREGPLSMSVSMKPRSLYSNPVLYDAINSQYTEDIPLLVSIIREFGGPVLELAAGTGRLALSLLKEGFEYTGLDLSDAYLERARAKMAEAGLRGGEMVSGDMRGFRLQKKFQMIFIGFNSFLDLLTDDDVESFLRSVSRHLRDEGRFVIDIFVPDPKYLFPGRRQMHIRDFEHPDGGVASLYEDNSYDSATRINNITWHVRRANTGQTEEYALKMRIYSPDSMRLILDKAGFDIERMLGDHNGGEFKPESRFQIYICKKRRQSKRIGR